MSNIYNKRFKLFFKIVLITLIFQFSNLYSVQSQVVDQPDNGLLFYLSAEKGFSADIAKGNPEPNFINKVNIIESGAIGKGIECETSQVLTYMAPGNIYAQRGTLGFFWKSREPLGKTEFPIFRVSYADHSSWDMVWLRIDYNGHGFDAFVTDINLSRVRVSYDMPKLPAPDEWTHIAFSWDEASGVKLYVNGKLAAQNNTPAQLDATLDQFGPSFKDHQSIPGTKCILFYQGW